MKRNFIFILLLSLITITGKAQIPLDGLKAYFSLDSDATDSSINNNDGVISGPIVGEKDRFGVNGNALFFDGLSNQLSLSDNSALNITQEITISVWIKPSAISIFGFTTLVNKWEDLPGVGGKGYYLGIDPNGVTAKWNTGLVAGNSEIIPVDEWTHLLVTYDKDSLKVYKNCMLEDATLAIDPIQETSVPFKLGQQSQIFSSTQYFNGIMDEVLVYDRALEYTEIQNICSNLTSVVNDLTQDVEVNFRPNPFNNYIEINTDYEHFENGILLNSEGRVLKQIDNFASPHLLDTSGLKAGFYIIMLYTSNGGSVFKKIVKY